MYAVLLLLNICQNANKFLSSKVEIYRREE